MPGAVRPMNLIDILQTIYGAATGQTGVSTTAPTSVISLVSEAAEQLVLADSVTGISAAPAGWEQAQWGAVAWG